MRWTWSPISGGVLEASTCRSSSSTRWNTACCWAVGQAGLRASDDKIEEILACPEYGGIEFHHTGDVPINAVLNGIIETDAAKMARSAS
jgi:hypothetical protein